MKPVKQIFRFGSCIMSVIILVMTLFTPTSSAQTDSVKWHSFEKAIQTAEENQQIILVDVWAPWCGWCKKMQNEVYPNVSENLSKQFLWTRLNQDDHESDLQFKTHKLTPFRLAQNLNVQQVPALVFLTSRGNYLFHISGFTEVKTLESILEYVVSDTYQDQSYEQFISTN